QVTVRVPDASGATTRSARVLARDPSMDLAVLAFADASDSWLTVGSTPALRVSDEVMAVGEPSGLAWTATFGRISAIRSGRGFDLAPEIAAVQFDAAVNPGNSGGPLLARDGRVVGIVTFGVRNTEGLSFAVAGDAPGPRFETGSLTSRDSQATG